MPNSHLLKHPPDHAHVEMHMRVQAGAESVDECDGTHVQGDFMHLSCTIAVELQALPTYRVASPQYGEPL